MSDVQEPDASQAGRNRDRRGTAGLWLLILVTLFFLAFALLGRIG